MPIPVSGGPAGPRGPARIARLLCVVALALAPAAALAQDSESSQDQKPPEQQDQGLGLDLSSPTTPGLDLSAPENGPDLRPTIAVAGVAADPAEADLARALGGALVQIVRGKPGFKPVITPEQVAEALGGGYAEALKCNESACLDNLAASADVERLVVGQLERDGRRFALTLLAFGRNQSTPASARVEGASKVELARKAKGALGPLLSNLAIPLAMLKVTTNLTGATVTLDEREVGTGSIEKPVPSGEHTLRVAAAEYSTYEAPVTLEPGGRLEVEAMLKELPSTRRTAARVSEALQQSPQPVAAGPLWKRPQPYMVAAGLALVGVGIGMGASAQGVAQKAQDGATNGLQGVTREQLLGAQRAAGWADGLIGVGGALAVGGAAWFYVTLLPARTPAAPASASEPGLAGLRAPGGLGLVATGSF